jgi:starch synthase
LTSGLTDQKNPMIIHLTSEVTPYYKRGGLGDVTGALPQHLSADYPNVVISFFYEGKMNKANFNAYSFFIEIQGIDYEFIYYHHNHDEIDYYFINMSDKFIYSELEAGEIKGDDEDGEKPYKQTVSFIIYLYFAKAALVLIDKLGLLPDYILFHDWHVCGCFAYPALMDSISRKNKFYTIVLVHNYDHQHDVYPDSFRWLEDEVKDRFKKIYSKYGMATMLSLGTEYADYTATVSAGYAIELKKGLLPHTGLDFLNHITKRSLFALPNGIDASFWSPETSPFISSPYNRYSAKTNKLKAKEALLAKYKLHDSDGPVVLLMSRLTEQKGLTLLNDSVGGDSISLHSLLELLNTGITLLVCGRPSGGKNSLIHRILTEAEQKFPGQFAYIPQYSDEIAHQLLAGSDAILCPSLFEPCGLVHIYGMAFGTIPIVRPVGGLGDTVTAYKNDMHNGTGIYIEEFNYQSLLAALTEVVELFRSHPHIWEKLIERCMDQDFSWEKAKENYLAFFKQIRKEHLPASHSLDMLGQD